LPFAQAFSNRQLRVFIPALRPLGRHAAVYETIRTTVYARPRGRIVNAAGSSQPQVAATNRLRFCDNAAEEWRGGGGVPVDGHPGTDGEKYAAFVKELLEAEDKRTAGLETRAIAVISTSGTLTTLLLGLAALITNASDWSAPAPALVAAVAAGVAFVGAAACAMLAHAPGRGWGLKPDSLRAELWQRWGAAEDDPQSKVTATRLALWETAREQTQRKAYLLSAATIGQLIAIACLVAMVIIIVVYA
jgi:hypothetical protein